MKLRWAMVFAGGLVAGMVLYWALEVLATRQGGAPGGEVLLPLLAGLLVYLGYTLRDLVALGRREGSE